MYQLSPKRLETWRGEWRAKGELAFPGQGARPQAKLDAERIPELERKIGQQAMEIDFLKKALRRFREQVPPAVGNGGTNSTRSTGIPFLSRQWGIVRSFTLRNKVLFLLFFAETGPPTARHPCFDSQGTGRIEGGQRAGHSQRACPHCGSRRTYR